eukprot:Blabericola_migrator_1__4879@NODE_2550_length_2619_cov_82_736285_g297_i1_p5_GENE_NODE_2550_length_2619_cov_82_736285_g297_i1NODE_2550_length_2619_cov_82_736285_g297_i1_p5_ORF_typecomplete_len119_score27_74_NODE_2550_length_2619_cov_82_736285_g297_i110341390
MKTDEAEAPPSHRKRPREDDEESTTVPQEEGEPIMIQRGDEVSFCIKPEATTSPLSASVHPAFESIPRNEDFDLLRSKLALLGREQLVNLVLLAVHRNPDPLCRVIDEVSLDTMCADE